MFTFFFGCAGSSLLCRLSLVVESRVYSLIVVDGPLITEVSLCRVQALWAEVSAVSVRELILTVLNSRTQAQQLWYAQA